jgi:hypothetical protein
LFDLTLRVSKKRTDLPGFGRVKVTWPEIIYKVPVPGVSGYSSSTCMWLREIAIGLKARHFISDRRCGDIKLR